MRSITNSTNPYEAGVKPKKFLEVRVDMLKEEKKHKKVNKEFYPKSHLKKDPEK